MQNYLFGEGRQIQVNGRKFWGRRRGIWGRSRPEAETHFAFGRSMDIANLLFFLKLENNKIRFFNCF